MYPQLFLCDDQMIYQNVNINTLECEYFSGYSPP